ncbi:MAG TPA: hypothetical protein VKZ18_28150 [Polyangia bacterium]|nr:hypothetical protein [Polyangia bacterium]
MLAMVWPAAPDPPVRTEVVALRSRFEFLSFARDLHVPSVVWGVRGQREPLPATLVFAGADLKAQASLAHELAHELIAWFMPLAPPWLNEGLATFLETLRYDRVSGKATLGEPSPRARIVAEPMPAAALLAAREPPTGREVEFEDRAWLLVHYLIDERLLAFERFQTELIRLRPPAEAWAAALPELRPADLDVTLDGYRRSDRCHILRLPVQVSEAQISVRLMADGEVHAVRALLFETSMAPGVMPDHSAAQSEVAESLRVDSTNVEALAMRFFWFSNGPRPEERSALAARALAAHPDAWLAWFMQAASAGDETTRRTALARAIAIGREQPELLTALASVDARAGRWDQVLDLATKASKIGDHRWSALELRMLALAHLGRCQEAEDLAIAVQALAPGNTGAQIQKAWGAVKGNCVQVAAHSGGPPSPASMRGAPPEAPRQ